MSAMPVSAWQQKTAEEKSKGILGIAFIDQNLNRTVYRQKSPKLAQMGLFTRKLSL